MTKWSTSGHHKKVAICSPGRAHQSFVTGAWVCSWNPLKFCGKRSYDLKGSHLMIHWFSIKNPKRNTALNIWAHINEDNILMLYNIRQYKILCSMIIPDNESVSLVLAYHNDKLSALNILRSVTSPWISKMNIWKCHNKRWCHWFPFWPVSLIQGLKSELPWIVWSLEM